ncbi:uncharacterized protein LOC139930199 isoform X1 [Centroberyx gerrardi]
MPSSLACAVPGCTSTDKLQNKVSFFHIPAKALERWTAFLVSRGHTGVISEKTLICSAHFPREHFKNFNERALGFAKRFVLVEGAVPSLPPLQPLPLPTPDTVVGPSLQLQHVKTEFDSILPLSEDALPTSAEPVPPLQPETKDIASQYVNLHLQDNWTSMGKRLGHFRSKGIQVNLPRRDVSFNVNEMCPLNMERPTVQHIIDEKAILQLLEHCPKCNRKCRCTKHTRSPYFIVYQSCYFCEYRRKWANQPEARNIKILKQRGPKKKKLPALNNESVNAEPQPSHLEKICVSKSPDSESNHQLQS